MEDERDEGEGNSDGGGELVGAGVAAGGVIARRVTLPAIHVANDAADEEGDSCNDLETPQRDDDAFLERHRLREVPRH